MKKHTKNGFFLSETMVVIAVVAVVLLGVFKIFSSVYSKYKESENYNTTNATNAVVSIKKYYQSVGFDYATLLGSNYYVELTNSDTFDSEYYDNLKQLLKIDNVYLIDMAQLFSGENINVFDTSFRKYLKTLQNSGSTVILASISNDSEYGSVTVVSGETPTLVGNIDDEFIYAVPVNGTYEDPGYINWTGDAPTTEWETELDTSTPGTYYLRYSFDGYLLRRKVIVYQQNYAYTGSYQTFSVPSSGYYKIELWGASGGAGRNGNADTINELTRGYGGYTSGIIYLEAASQLYLYLGEEGEDQTGTTAYSYGVGGYNGGGDGGYENTTETYPENGAGGGGATDVRLVSGNWDNSTSLASRIMVAGAAGGGGSGDNVLTYAGDGGYLVGESVSTYTIGGGQDSGYQLGVGKTGYISSSNYGAYGGGGSGYYGGTWTSSNTSTTVPIGGGGGSSFISGFAGVNAITSSSSTTPTNNILHYSGKYFIDGEVEGGVNEGNGSAKITYISNTVPEKTNTDLNGVRYIKDCINGSTSSTTDIWLEIQAIYNATNVAYGKTVTGTVAQNSSYPYSRITDGNINYSVYARPDTYGLQCVTVDLGQTYDLDEIAVWHYWIDGRRFYENTTYVSSDNSTWIKAISNNDPETSNGKRVNAWDEPLTRNNTGLEDVQFVRDCVDGSSVNTGNHWVELQAIKDGTNLASGITATGTTAITNVSYITDNAAVTANYASETAGAKCVTIDLGQQYDLDEVRVWHYFSDSRTYYGNLTYTSTNGTIWNPIIATEASETTSGKVVTAWNGTLTMKTTNLNNARYVKDCMNGSSANTGNHWVELKAIKDGVNLALGLTATGTSSISNVAYITDGSITTSNYSQTSTTGSLQCITIDLGQTYDLDEIAVWHYYYDGRTYYDNVTYVSSDNSTWVEAMNTGDQAETSKGKRVDAWR